MANKYLFEVLCIESNDIRDQKSLAQGLAFSKSVWLDNTPKIESNKGISNVIDKGLGIRIQILPADTSNAVSVYLETAFFLVVEGNSFDIVESFRGRILRHLKCYT